MAEPAPELEQRHLRAITPEEALAEENRVLHAQLAGAEKELRAWRLRYAALAEEESQADMADDLWKVGERLFIYQCRKSGHVTKTGKPTCKWTPKRFKMVRRRLKEPDGLRECLRAIAGNLNDPWRQKNGINFWDDVFGSQEKLERAISRCPADWTPPPGAADMLA